MKDDLVQLIDFSPKRKCEEKAVERATNSVYVLQATFTISRPSRFVLKLSRLDVHLLSICKIFLSSFDGVEGGKNVSLTCLVSIHSEVRTPRWKLRDEQQQNMRHESVDT